MDPPSTNQSKNKKQKLNKTQALAARQYYQPHRPGSFAGASTHLRHATNLKKRPLTKKQRADRLKWLKHQDAYTRHAPVRRKFPRRQVIVPGIHHQYQADLIDLPNIAGYNKGHRYILTVIDVFSKKAYARPLKQKTGAAVTKAFESILEEGQGLPKTVLTDKGLEFKNSVFDKLLKLKNIRLVHSQNEDIKASVIERFNKTLKNKLFRYFMRQETYKFIDVLQPMLDSYNATYHTAIKTQPRLVTKQNQDEIHRVLYKKALKRHFSPAKNKPFKLNLGDKVRLAVSKTAFQRGYTPRWTKEIFTVHQRRYAQGIPVYRVKDNQQQVIIGSFYQQELLQVYI